MLLAGKSFVAASYELKRLCTREGAVAPSDQCYRWSDLSK
jgi:hypothetical protein